MLHQERHKLENKLNVIPGLINLRRNERSTTEQKQQTHHARAKQEINLLSFIEKSKDFTSIFTKHKRSEYSGYKQINMNKSKNIRFENEHREISRYQTPRKYQMNLKNIAKLRKRYSLQPSLFKQNSKGHKQYFIQTLKSVERPDERPLEICSDRRCERELKEIIREMKTSKHFSTENALMNYDKKQDYTTQRQKVRVPTMIEDQLNQQYLSLHISEKLKETGKPHMKLSVLKLKKGKKLQISDIADKKYCNNQLQLKDEQENLCGWQSKSFYHKKKYEIFQGFKY